MEMGYDGVILQVGNFGPYQRRILFVLIIPAIACGFHKMGGIFLTAKADFRCLSPYENQENATYQSPPKATNFTHLWNEETGTWPQCERQNAEFLNPDYKPGENLTSMITTVKCDSFVYDKTHYTQTVTTENHQFCNGRKTALLWGSIMQLIFALLVVVSPNFIAFTVLRVLVGATTSSLFLVVYVTAVEMVGPRNRNTAGVILNLSYATGYLLSACLAYFIRKWRYLQIAFTVPTIALLAFWWSIPESARWLLTKGRVQEAKDILQNISSENGMKLSPETLLALSHHDAGSDQVVAETSVLDLLRYPNLRRKSLILFIIWFVSSLTYYGLSWNTSNLGGNDYVNFSIAASVEVPAYLSLLYTSDRWGRKIVVCSGMLFAGTSLLLTSCVPTGITWLMILLAMNGKFAVSCAWVSLYIFTAEQYPTSIRNLALACCSSVARIAGALAPHINLLFEIATYLPLGILGFAALVAGMLTLLLPETLNKKLPETIGDGENLKSTSDAEQVSKT